MPLPLPVNIDATYPDGGVASILEHQLHHDTIHDVVNNAARKDAANVFTPDQKIDPGKLLFGADVNLYRSAANVLKTDDALVVAGQSIAAPTDFSIISVGGAGATDVQFRLDTTGGGWSLREQGDGSLQIQEAGIANRMIVKKTSGDVRLESGKLLFGSAEDTNLYRSAVDTLKTDDKLVVAPPVVSGTILSLEDTFGNTLKIDRGDTFNVLVSGFLLLRLKTDQIAVEATNGFYWGNSSQKQNSGFTASGAGSIALHVNGAAAQTADLQRWRDSALASLLAVAADGKLLFGNLQDTNLYRGAADTLKTDDSLTQGAGMFHEFLENGAADPAAGAANTCRLYVRDNGAGKTQLCARFNTGAVQVLATEPV